jgi:hypothetical protein
LGWLLDPTFFLFLAVYLTFRYFNQRHTPTTTTTTTNNKLCISVAPYLIFRAPPVERKTLSDSSWFTANVLENKLFGLLLVALVLSVPLTTGLVDALLSPSISNDRLISEFATAFASSKFVSVSTFDLACLTATAATLIPRDYQLRSVSTTIDDDNVDLEQAKQQGRFIALATMLLPILGAALYIAWRPPLPEK